MIKAVIFDMDGVLVDNRDVHVEAFRLLAAQHGVPFDDGDLEWMYGRGNDTIIPALFPPAIVDRVGLAQLGKEKESIYRRIYADSVVPVRGLVTLLNDLHYNNIPCAVGSSATKANVDFVLDKCGIEDDFSVVVTGDMVTLRKPDPAIFNLAAQLLGVVPAECLVFEDSVAGLQAAKTAGMPVIALSTTLTTTKIAEVHDWMVIPDFADVNYETIKNL